MTAREAAGLFALLTAATVVAYAAAYGAIVGGFAVIRWLT